MVNIGLIRLQIVPRSIFSIADKDLRLSQGGPRCYSEASALRRNSLSTATVTQRFRGYCPLQFRLQRHCQPRRTSSNNRRTESQRSGNRRHRTSLQTHLPSILKQQVTVSSVLHSECDLTLTAHHSVAHPRHDHPRERRRGGGLDHGPTACDTCHRKMHCRGKDTTSISITQLIARF